MPEKTKRKSSRQLDREIDEALARPKEHLEYREIGKDGDPWPAWLIATKKSCGVYVIRDKSTGEAAYVGSSNKALYGTITRHFQRWRRSKQFWKGYHGTSGHNRRTDHDPGLTYTRGDCEVGIRVMRCGEEMEEEARLIARLRPQDNLVDHPDGEDAPF